MFLVGLTGGIATGKSTVSRIFAHELGVPVVDADLIAKKGKQQQKLDDPIRFKNFTLLTRSL